MNCKDCIHERVCKNAYLFKVTPPNVCGYFKNKANYTEVKHGYWKTTVAEKNGNAYCSVCNNFDWNDCNYCSKCGAMMRSDK